MAASVRNSDPQPCGRSAEVLAPLHWVLEMESERGTIVDEAECSVEFSRLQLTLDDFESDLYFNVSDEICLSWEQA